MLHHAHRTPLVGIELESDVVSGQREPAEAGCAAGEPTEGEIGEVTQIGQIQFLQMDESRPYLQRESGLSFNYTLKHCFSKLSNHRVTED